MFFSLNHNTVGSPDGSHLKRDPTLDNVIKREINSPGPTEAESFRKTDYRPQTRSPHSTQKRRIEGARRKKKDVFFFTLLYFKELEDSKEGGEKKTLKNNSSAFSDRFSQFCQRVKKSLKDALPRKNSLRLISVGTPSRPLAGHKGFHHDLHSVRLLREKWQSARACLFSCHAVRE